VTRVKRTILVAVAVSLPIFGGVTSCSTSCGSTMLAAARCSAHIIPLPNSPGFGFGEEPGDGTVGPI
jgi:hypothetical protein